MRAVLITLLLIGILAFAAFATQTGRSAPKSGPMEIRIDPDRQAKLARFEARLEALRQERHIPALSAAVLQNQEVIYLKGLGSMPDGRSATVDTIYPLRCLIRPVGHPWTVRDLAQFDILRDHGGIVEIQPDLAWRTQDSAGTRLQWAWEHGKEGSVLYLKAREKRLTLILMASGEIEKSAFVDAFTQTFF